MRNTGGYLMFLIRFGDLARLPVSDLPRGLQDLMGLKRW